MHGQIDDAAIAAGRDPAAIRRLYNVFGLVTDGRNRGLLHGPVGQMVDELTALVVDGARVDAFIFGPAEDPVRQVQPFANEIVPIPCGRLRVVPDVEHMLAVTPLPPGPGALGGSVGPPLGRRTPS